MFETFKIGVIGMGFGADVHVPALLSTPGIVVTGLADAGSGRAARVAAGMQPSPQVFANAADLIASDNVDAVVVATPPRQQAVFVQQAMVAGKAILCEKPLGLTPAISEALAAEARSRNVLACVGFEFRYDPGVRMLWEAFHENRIGPLERVDIAWITGGGARKPPRWGWRNDIDEAGGVITDFGIHVIDYIRWISGEDIQIHLARADIRVRERTGTDGRIRLATSPDVVEFLANTESGIHVNAVVSNAYAAAFGHRIELTGRKGRLTFFHRPPFGIADLNVVLDAGGESLNLMESDSRRPEHQQGGPDTRVQAFAALFRDFVAAARGQGSEHLPRFDDAVAARRVTHAIEVASGFAA